MWEHRAVLKRELEDHDLNNAADIHAKQYQHLVNSAEGWWTVMRLFKKKQFTTGLFLSVNKVFGTLTQEKTSLATLTSTPVAVPTELPPLQKTTLHSKNNNPPRKPPSSRLKSHDMEGAPPHNNGTQLSAPVAPSHAAHARAKQNEGSGILLRHPQDELKEVEAASTQGAKRHRSSSPEGVAGVAKTRSHPSRRATVEALDIEALAQPCSSNRRLNFQLARFANTAHTLKKDEAGIVSKLLEDLLVSKEKGTLARVAQGLVDNMPVRFRSSDQYR